MRRTGRRALLSGSMAIGLFTAGGRLLAAGREPLPEPIPDGRPHAFTLHRDGFRLDGAPFQVRSGEMHPIRIPRAEWPARIAMAKAMGLNTIAIYLMWNTLEAAPGQFDLTTDRRDFRAFLTLCRQAGLWVFLRPGPYVCGEWDFGGLPAWLLYDGAIRVRSMDPAFLAAAERYIATIAQAVRPFLADRGGPILMTQIENEYASFGADPAYMAWTRDAWRRHGLSGACTTADGLAQLRERRTILPACAMGLDGDYALDQARDLAPDAPLWISEAYPGWLTHWGDRRMATVDFAPDFRKILLQKASFNLYVVHGGTNFGFGAGANARRDGSRFQPVVTSYDYDAPIDEAGRATPKYHALRAMIADATGRPSPPVPADPPILGFAPVMARAAGSLWSALGDPIHAPDPVSMERGLRQPAGMALYRCVIPAGRGGALRLPPVHDDARLILDGTDLCTLSRLFPAPSPPVIAPAPRPRRLDILVDSFGHVGFGPAMGDRKGLDGPVTLGGLPLVGWTIFGLPLDADQRARATRHPPEPGLPVDLYRARFDMPGPGGTYLDLSEWRKGHVWANGHALGRFWSIGPQHRLFCPAEFLRPTGNDLLILDCHVKAPARIAGRRLSG
ncbi:beta-galactosidase [Gluconacetobacter sacchari]|uniref:Beta-galactosidase n=2 Tax=Gluconacetobacter sacchari TaxID=92759 RepID=A0A7W4IED4_9PROT|nr:beta-galactosidase [Gluconacetobacter sacchari]MBB2161318.1 beta-galactosidase [Gluconacetobacter sacchari]